MVEGGKETSLKRRTKVSLVWLTLLVVIVAVGILVAYPDYLKLKEFRTRLKELATNVERLEEANRKLEEEICALRSDPTYIEKLARRMGLVRPGEIIYKIIKEGEKNDD